MKFTNSLIKGKLIKRYKRFFVDIEVNNKIITAHCPNTGSMLGLLNKNSGLSGREVGRLAGESSLVPGRF